MQDYNKYEPEETSLLETNDNIENIKLSLLDNPTADTLLTAEDPMYAVELNNDIMSKNEIQARRAFFSDPKNQAKILLNNYVKSQEILVNHSQRRKVYAEFYRNAKKGKYKRIFAEYINGVSKDESQKNFAKLNG